ncbi:MFS transporter [Rhodoplanes sp. TEM]|uniref:MFS transporter n=1 Tax=Rhodoplanes tepidamans TaxID=200616 RepID=A0ABT5JFJ9_RHOTP|nr:MULTISPECIES: MFS transporter [Rhodoplanes]MDC7788193.1 MFS transporter [Rhodoplanes tepidamans]MDC7987890.1 MFS transporter [Rhodoplanes sp. TEM]MDQ0354223.1 MFS family permease [Rhodoplanes tepidamans]
MTDATSLPASDAAAVEAAAVPHDADAARQAKPVVFLGVFACYLGMTVILPIVSPLVRELGLSESQGGWMVSIGAVAVALASTGWGRWSDRVGRRPVILAGFAGLAASYAVFTASALAGLSGVLAGTALFAALVAGRALVGAFVPAVPTAAQAYMADVTDAAGRSGGMALIGAANGMAMVLGPALGGLLLLGGLMWPLYAATLLPLASLVLVTALLRRTAPRPAAVPERLPPWRAGLWPWLLVGLAVMTAIVTLQINAGFFLQDRLGLTALATARTLAVALTLTGLALLVVQALQMRLRWPAVRLVAVGLPVLVAGVVALLLAGASPWGCYAAFVLIGLGAGLILPGYMAGASLAVSETLQGSVAGLASAVQGAGMIVAPVVTTRLYEIDAALPFWLIVAVLAVALVVWAGALRIRPARGGDADGHP